MDDDTTFDYEFYDTQFDIPPRRRGGGKRKHDARPERAIEEAGLSVAPETEAQREMTYVPARFEAVWLRASVASFYDEEWITDVLASVKGGKEANVYRCEAHPRTGHELLAAKVYRPRAFRNLRNDKMYRDGRTILTADGRAAKTTDQRLAKAIGKKSSYGKKIAHASWLMHEYTTLERLAQLGAAVPQPIAVNENALLMGYRGDRWHAAPILRGVRMEAREARHLFDTVMHNIELMLGEGLIHGDLSAHNILYWEGEITIIDFPQVSYVATNQNAYTLFERDVVRVCEYFMSQGMTLQPRDLARSVWQRHVQEDIALHA